MNSKDLRSEVNREKGMVKKIENALNRRSVVKAILKDRGEKLLITGLGSPSYDAHAAGDNVKNFYLWGAMGGAAMGGQRMLTGVNECQQMSMGVNRCQRMSTSIKRYQRMSPDVKRYKNRST